MESDADRLASIKALDGRLVSVRGIEFWAIFDNGSVDVFEMVESRGPSLHCRSSDIERGSVVKEDVIDGLPEVYRVKKLENDGTGMTLVLLKK